MKHFFCYSLLLGLSFFSLRAQVSEVAPHQVSLSYFGEFVTHAGLRLGYARPLSQSQVERRRMVSNSTKPGSPVLAFTRYRTYATHTGTMLTLAIGRQRTAASGFVTSFNLEGGYMHARLNGEVFAWNGDSFEAGRKGSSHVVVGLNGGIGLEFSSQNGVAASSHGAATRLHTSPFLTPHFFLASPWKSRPSISFLHPLTTNHDAYPILFRAGLRTLALLL